MRKLRFPILRSRVAVCWLLMNDSERHGARFGLLPLWTTKADLGGKAESDSWPLLQGEQLREFSLAMQDRAALEHGEVC